MAVIDTNNICLTWESLSSPSGKHLKTTGDSVCDEKNRRALVSFRLK